MDESHARRQAARAGRRRSARRERGAAGAGTTAAAAGLGARGATGGGTTAAGIVSGSRSRRPWAHACVALVVFGVFERQRRGGVHVRERKKTSRVAKKKKHAWRARGRKSRSSCLSPTVLVALSKTPPLVVIRSRSLFLARYSPSIALDASNRSQLTSPARRRGRVKGSMRRKGANFFCPLRGFFRLCASTPRWRERVDKKKTSKTFNDAPGAPRPQTWSASWTR